MDAPIDIPVNNLVEASRNRVAAPETVDVPNIWAFYLHSILCRAIRRCLIFFGFFL
jgi:hypothetical protein